LCPLPGTGVEVQTLHSLLEQRHWNVVSYEGSQALEEAVKQVHHPRVLHLATHGFFLEDSASSDGTSSTSLIRDPMLRSGLYFAGADHALSGEALGEDLDDGVLTAYEAAGLNLQGTELVVLSACDTGRGESRNGEGVFGLKRALQAAGAESVLMSQWSVPDLETQELMALFYREWLAGTEKHEALRHAQLLMRQRVRARYGADIPYYWGAFVLVGN
jgi:CHAT domain-containing protein